MTERRFAAVAASAVCAVLGAVCAAGAAQHAPAQHAPTHRKPSALSKPAIVVRVRIVSGTPQSAHAYVAPAAAIYVTAFTRPLVVRVSGSRNPAIGVRFVCITKGCNLPPQVQPDEVKRIDPRTFEAQSKNGVASIELTVSTDTPETVEVVAEPVAGHGERAAKSAPFRLTER